MEKAAGIAKLLLWIALHQTDELGVQMDETVIFHGSYGLYESYRRGISFKHEAPTYGPGGLERPEHT